MLLRLSRLKLPNSSSSINLILFFFFFSDLYEDGIHWESIRGFLVLNGPFWANCIVGPPSFKFVLFFFKIVFKVNYLVTRLIFNCHFIAPLTSVLTNIYMWKTLHLKADLIFLLTFYAWALFKITIAKISEHFLFSLKRYVYMYSSETMPPYGNAVSSDRDFQFAKATKWTKHMCNFLHAHIPSFTTCQNC